MTKHPTLSKQQRHFLRRMAHKLNPVIIIGDKGLTDNVTEEIALALKHHELIKVRVNAENSQGRESMIEHILRSNDTQLVQAIGHIAILYKKAKKPTIHLPDNKITA